MPVFFENLTYDYYLVFIMIFSFIGAAVMGLIMSYTAKHNPRQLMTYICTILSVCMLLWALWIARVSFAKYKGFVLYSMYFMIGLALITSIQLGLMNIYVQYIYTTSLFRVMLILVLVHAFMTCQYRTTSDGMLMYNILGLCISTSALFIIVTVLTSRFTYYLKNN
jgi:hypothetical protein